MARFNEAVARLFGRVYVCRKCKRKKRCDPSKVRLGKAMCRKCGSKALRPIKRGK